MIVCVFVCQQIIAFQSHTSIIIKSKMVEERPHRSSKLSQSKQQQVYRKSHSVVTKQYAGSKSIQLVPMIGLLSIKVKQDWQSLVSESASAVDNQLDRQSVHCSFDSAIKDGGIDQAQEIANLNKEIDVDACDLEVNLQPASLPGLKKSIRSSQDLNALQQSIEQEEFKNSKKYGTNEPNPGQKRADIIQDTAKNHTEVQAQVSKIPDKPKASGLANGVLSDSDNDADGANSNTGEDEVNSVLSLIQMVQNSKSFKVDGRRFSFKADSKEIKEIESLLAKRPELKKEEIDPGDTQQKISQPDTQLTETTTTLLQKEQQCPVASANINSIPEQIEGKDQLAQQNQVIQPVQVPTQIAAAKKKKGRKRFQVKVEAPEENSEPKVNSKKVDKVEEQSNLPQKQQNPPAEPLPEEPKHPLAINLSELLKQHSDMESQVKIKTKGEKPANLKILQSTFGPMMSQTQLWSKSTKSAQLSSILQSLGLQDDYQDLLKRVADMDQSNAPHLKGNEKDGQQVDIVFLHASPLVKIDKQITAKEKQCSEGLKKQYTIVPPLNFRQEALQIKQAIKNSGYQVNYMSEIATKSNFEHTFSRIRPKIIHISCHGSVREADKANKSVGLSSKAGENLKNHFLVLEDLKGSCELVSAYQLKEFLVTETKHDVDLIVVAACQSEQIGRMFQKCSVKHVVCVEQSRKVLDTAAIKFTETFYSKVFQQKKICSAFKEAVDSVKFIIEEKEANLFMLLLAEEPDEPEKRENLGWEKKHQCLPLLVKPLGEMKCVSDHNLIKQIPAKHESLKSREKEIAILLDLLNNKHDRIISVIGLRGIGKTSLAINTLHFVAERKTYSRGILFVQLKDARNCLQMSKCIMRAILKCLEFDEKNQDSQEKFMEKNSSLHVMTQYFINFFNGNQEENLKKKKLSKKEDRFLLCLDNVDKVIESESEREAFLKFLEELLEECQCLKMIVTSDFFMGQLPKGTNPKPYIVNALSLFQSAELFFENAGELKSKDVVDFVFQDKKFPLQNFIKSFTQHRLGDVKEGDLVTLKEQLEAFIQVSDDNLKEVISKHDMFQQMQGNPTSISLMAAICANEMIERDTLNPLVDIYNKIKEEEDIVVKQIGQDEAGMKKQYCITYKNTMSLKITAETSIALLKQAGSQNALFLLKLLSFLPGGIKAEQLQIMTTDIDYTEDFHQLENLNFLEKNMDKLLLTPFVLHYCQTINRSESHSTEVLRQITHYYIGILAAIFKQIGRQPAPFFQTLQDVYHTNSKEDGFTKRQSLRDCFMSQQSSEKNYSKRTSFKSIPDSKGIKRMCSQVQQLPVEDREIKTLFEQLESEQQNLDFCIHFLIDNKHRDEKLLNMNQTLIKSHQLTSQQELANFKRYSKQVKNPLVSIKEHDSNFSNSDDSSDEEFFNLEKDKDQTEAPDARVNIIRSTTLRGRPKDLAPASDEDNLTSTKTKQEYIPQFDEKGQIKLNQIEELSEKEDSLSLGSQSDEKTSKTGASEPLDLGPIKLKAIQSETFSFGPMKKQDSKTKKLDLTLIPSLRRSSTSQNAKAVSKTYGIIAEDLTNHKDIRLNDGGYRVRNRSADTEEYARSSSSKSNDDLSSFEEPLVENEEKFANFSQQRQRVQNVKIKWPKKRNSREILDAPRGSQIQADMESLIFSKFSQQKNFSFDGPAVASDDQTLIKMHHFHTQSYSTNLPYWRHMSDVGHFILLAVANAFLTNDFEYSLQISTNNFLAFANSSHFEGNILRYQSLASIKLFERSLQQKNSFENFDFLAQALDAAQNALQIYQPDDKMMVSEHHHYGIALSNYQIGYIYHYFGFALCDEQIRQVKDFKQYFHEDEGQTDAKANACFEAAYQSFNKIDHLVGKYLSKLRKCQTLLSQGSSEQLGEEKQAKKLLKKLQVYHDEYGIEKSCFINREQGEDISLMVEIVEEQLYDKVLFPRVIQKLDQKEAELQKSAHDKGEEEKKDDFAFSRSESQIRVASIKAKKNQWKNHGFAKSQIQPTLQKK